MSVPLLIKQSSRLDMGRGSQDQPARNGRIVKCSNNKKVLDCARNEFLCSDTFVGGVQKRLKSRKTIVHKGPLQIVKTATNCMIH